MSTRLMAAKRICERCNRPYPYVKTDIPSVLLLEKCDAEEIIIDYKYAEDTRSEGYTGQRKDPSSNKNHCYECVVTLLQEENLIQLKRQRDFRKIPNMEKAMMFVGQQLPTDICWFCGVKINVGHNHSDRNIIHLLDSSVLSG